MPHPLYEMVAERARGLCEYCKTPERLAGYAFEVEHIVPVARGGGDTLGNLALACGPCNKAKGAWQRARDPESGDLVPLFNPRQDEWDAHFTWHDDFTVICGETPGGRATTVALRLNSVRRRDSRILWRALATLAIGDPPFRWP
ncbi:MAG: HNH endonuclease [Chloroflexi bacterium]|nr:HNH endonuclease [Chloroflexota bacterium]